MKRFLIALQFLTVIPVKIKSKIEEKDLGASLMYFPAVGSLIGLLLAVMSLMVNFLPWPVAIALVLIASIAITGAIHIDGFADTCDGFFSSKHREKILEIMRDSRIGTMGTVGIVCLLLLKFNMLISIPKEILWKSLILMVTFARWTQALSCYISDYAREDGKARYFIEYSRGRDFFIGTLFTLCLFLLLIHIKGAILFFVSIFPALLFINFAKRRIGGMTGDTIGAASEIAELTLLFFMLIYPKICI